MPCRMAIRADLCLGVTPDKRVVQSGLVFRECHLLRLWGRQSGKALDSIGILEFCRLGQSADPRIGLS